MFALEKLLREKNHNVIPFAAKNEKNLESPWEDFFPLTSNFDEGGYNRPTSYFYNFNAKKKISALLNNHKIDLAHLHIYYGKLTSSILAPLKERHIPIIQTLHEYKLVCPIYTLERNGQICNQCVGGPKTNVIKNRCKDNSLLASSARYLEWKISNLLGDLDSIDHFISVSNFHRKKMIEDGIQKEKISVVHNFVDTTEKNTCDFHDNYYLYLGRIERLKGIFTLIEAALNTGIKLKIIGSGSDSEEIVKLIENESSIEYLGFKSGDDLKEMVARSKCVIVPSEWYENCPMSILEAKSAGKMVVGSSIGGIPELIREGIDGYLFSPGNREELSNILTKIEDQKTEKEFGRAAFEDVSERFNKELHYEKLLSVYKKVL